MRNGPTGAKNVPGVNGASFSGLTLGGATSEGIRPHDRSDRSDRREERHPQCRTARRRESAQTDHRHRSRRAVAGRDGVGGVRTEAIVLVLAAAGGHGLGFTLPVTLAIAGLLAVLVASYRQVIAAFPDGGGSYAVAKARLGRRASLVAAASLVLDYVLNVAVAVTAGVAALTSAFPASTTTGWCSVSASSCSSRP